MSYWQQWLKRPRTVWLRKALFQIHLWSGLGVGLYLVVISVTGSVLVFRSCARRSCRSRYSSRPRASGWTRTG